MKRLAGTTAAIALILLALVPAAIYLSHRHHPGGLSGYQVQQLTGAGSCDATSYYITDRADHTKATLYDCWTSRRGWMCVTVTDGVAENVTVGARLLFRDVLGATQKPRCV